MKRPDTLPPRTSACVYTSKSPTTPVLLFTLKLFDYMASGLPVLGTDVGQIRRVIEENGNGILAGNSVEDIVSGLLRLKQDDRERREMGARGREAVRARYNWGASRPGRKKFCSRHATGRKAGDAGGHPVLFCQRTCRTVSPHGGTTS